MASTKSGLLPGPLSRRMIRSVYDADLVSKTACLPLAVTRSTERGLTARTRSQLARQQRVDARRLVGDADELDLVEVGRFGFQ